MLLLPNLVPPSLAPYKEWRILALCLRTSTPEQLLRTRCNKVLSNLQASVHTGMLQAFSSAPSAERRTGLEVGVCSELMP